MRKLITLIILLLVLGIQAISVISISRVDFVSYDNILKKKAWVVYASYDGSDQSVVGKFSSTELNALRSAGVGEKVKNDFQISMSLDEFTCEYPIHSQDEYVWDYDYSHKQLVLGIGASEFVEECRSNHPDWNRWGKGKCWEQSLPFAGFVIETVCDWYCLWRTPKARYGRILDPRTHFKATISLSSDGETKKGVVDSHTAKSVLVGDIAHISWQGYLGTDEECPTAQARGISAMYYNNDWILVDSDRYDDYKNFDISQCFRETVTGRITFDECISENDRLSQKALNQIPFNFYISDIGKSTSARIEGGTVVMDIPKLLKFPTFTMRIDADWLGVVVPKGNPKIVSLEAKTLQSGTEGAMVISVKNVGGGAGTFDVSVECESPINVLESPPRIIVGVGDTRKVVVRLYAESEETVTKECTVTVYEAEEPSIKDTAKTFVEVKPIVMCFIEGQKRCNGNVIEECKKGKWSKVVSCDYECSIVNGVPTCITPAPRCGNRVCEPPNENAITCPQDCQTICGNRICEPGETYENCPQDCKNPCQISCPLGDINCYNKIIQCWVNQITKSISFALTIVGISAIIILIGYVIINKERFRKWLK